MRPPSQQRSRTGRRGNVMIEFVLITVPVLFMTISIVEASIAMWQYHSMVYAVDATARYVTTHGRGCTRSGNTCSITVGNVTTLISTLAAALEDSKLNVTLTTASGATTCNPVNTCFSSTTQFPPATANGINSDITIAATYPVTSPLPLFWPGAGSSMTGVLTLGASSRQRINF
jgi:Flp pilus assembly protein TadG